MLVLRCGVLLLHMLVRGFVCSPLYKLQVPACGQALLPSNVEPLPACDPLCGAGLTCRMAVATTVDQGAKYKVLGENATLKRKNTEHRDQQQPEFTNLNNSMTDNCH